MSDIAFAELEEQVETLPMFQVIILKEKLEKRIENEQKSKMPSGFGCLSKYANPKLWDKEEDAWAIAAGEKHGIN